MFDIGDEVVYPMHGAGEVVGIEKKEILGEELLYYILRLPVNSMKVMVPVKNAEEVGMRHIHSKEEMDLVFDVLASDEKEKKLKNWNRRYRYNMERIKTGDVDEIAGVVRSLERLDREKSLSTGERKLLNNAKQIIVSEMMLVYDMDFNLVEEKVLAAIFSKEGEE